MKISISAIWRLRNSPEKELLDDYLSSFSKLSKPFGLSLNPVVEIEDKKGGGPMSEAKLLIKSFQKYLAKYKEKSCSTGLKTHFLAVYSVCPKIRFRVPNPSLNIK